MANVVYIDAKTMQAVHSCMYCAEDLPDKGDTITVNDETYHVVEIEKVITGGNKSYKIYLR